MEENKEEKIVNTEELKKETVDTVGKVKSTMKDLKIKDETMNAKNFVKDMVKDPISKTSEIAKDKENSFLKTSIFILFAWVLVNCTYYALSLGKYIFSGYGFKGLIITALSPLCIILGLSLIVFILNKKNKKSLTTVISTMVSAYLPTIVASIISLLNLINSNVYKITSPISMIATFITVILSYFAIKDIFEEETELGTFKKFVLVQVIYFAVAFVVSYFGISMY